MTALTGYGGTCIALNSFNGLQFQFNSIHWVRILINQRKVTVDGQGGDPLNRQFNRIEIEAIEVRASIQRQSTGDPFNVNFNPSKRRVDVEIH